MTTTIRTQRIEAAKAATPANIEDMKAAADTTADMEAAGAAAKAAGLPRAYGCHYGMRSTREADMAAFYRGFDGPATTKDTYRITATLQPGHDMASVVFTIRAANVARALEGGIKAMTQLGFKADDYGLTYSLPL